MTYLAIRPGPGGELKLYGILHPAQLSTIFPTQARLSLLFRSKATEPATTTALCSVAACVAVSLCDIGSEDRSSHRKPASLQVFDMPRDVSVDF